MDVVVYDCEIIKCVPDSKDFSPDPLLQYCDGWKDFGGMGISVIGAYDYREQRFRVFLQDNFNAFQQLVKERALIVGFNSISFDNNLCLSNGIQIPKDRNYDILVEVWRGLGLGPVFQSVKTHAGYGLDATAKANNVRTKTGHGALAPVLWQQGKYGAVIDYCLQDVNITKQLFDKCISQGYLKNPKNLNQPIKMRTVTEHEVHMP